MTIRKIIIVHGNVQKSDYRGRVISIAKGMDITGTIQNLSNGTVRIVAEGERWDIERFGDEIKIRNFLIKVTRIECGETKDITEIGREYESFYKLVGEGETDERLDTAAELLKELIVVTKDGFADTNKNFQKMDEKYGKLSEAMFAIVEKIENRNKTFEERIEKNDDRIEKIDERIEKIDERIEKLINLLIQQKNET